MARVARTANLGAGGDFLMHKDVLPPVQQACLASLEDLAAMKLLAVSQRGTKKDFIDVNALATRFSLAEMLDGYRRKFGVTDVTRVLAGLCYFDDAEADPMPTMLEPMEWQSVKASLRHLVATFAGR